MQFSNSSSMKSLLESKLKLKIHACPRLSRSLHLLTHARASGRGFGSEGGRGGRGRQESGPYRGSPQNGGRGGRGRGGGPDAPLQGLTRPQRNLLGGLDKLREGPKDTGPEDFVILRRPSASAEVPEVKTKLSAVTADEQLDGSRFWRERSGWDDDDEEGAEGEEGEDGEDVEDEEEDEDREILAEGPPPDPETPEQLALRQMYLDKATPPARFVDAALRFQEMKGRGRGVVATSNLELGRLLLVSEPLAVIYCKEGGTPENEELAEHMKYRSKLTAAQLALLERLHDGDGLKAWSGPDLIVTGEALSEAAKPGTKKLIDMPLDRLYSIVNTNVLGEEFQDQALSSLRGEDSQGHIGLWPEAALINHSCCPNSTSFTLGDRLVAHTTEEVAQGNEITLNWVGQLITAPLQQRKAELSEKYGFICECKRCKAEAGIAGTPLEVTVLSTYERCQDIGPSLEAAIEGEDRAKLSQIRSELDALRMSLEEAMRTMKVSSKLKAWLQASVYDLYDMMSLTADELGDEAAGNRRRAGSVGAELLDTERLAWCTRILNQVARGTDAHCYLTAELMVRTANRFSRQHQEATSAVAACKDAFTARYGPISTSLFEELANARLGV